MATLGRNTLEIEVPDVVLRTPVEIWQEIIDQVLFDPIIFSTDPFYPGCNPHTALDEWHDVKRLRRQEIQQALLRLVSRSWKMLVDRSPWQFFEPRRTVSDDQLLSEARRLGMRPACKDCEPIWWKEVGNCDPCHISGDRRTIHKLLTIERPMKVETLFYTLTMWSNQDDIQKLEINFFQSMPRLRVLFMEVKKPLTRDIASVFSNLTSLGLRILFWTNYDGLNGDESSTLLMPSVRVLQLIVGEDANCDFITKWHMPCLVHLDFMTVGGFHMWGGCIYPFIENTGKDLITACLRCIQATVHLPGNMWKLVPRLEYLGVSLLGPSISPPPPGHPLRTFALLENIGHIEDFRGYVRRKVLGWKGLVTIADSHYWEDMPQNFNQEDHGVGVPHRHDAKLFCWECDMPFYMECKEYGLRYEDLTGRTFAEFQAQQS